MSIMDQRFPKNISWSEYCCLKCSECDTEQRVTPKTYPDFITAHAFCSRTNTEERRRVAAQVLAGMLSVAGTPKTSNEDMDRLARRAVQASEALAKALSETSPRQKHGS